MIFRVSNATKRLVGTLEAGEEFVEVLTRICKEQGVRAGEIRAVGHFDAIELVHFDSTTQSYKSLVDGEGSFDLVSLNGNISTLGDEVVLRLDGVFNVVGPLGPQMVGGQLRRARVVSAEFVVESFADLRMERRLDAASGRLMLEEIERVAAPPAAAPAATPAAGEEVGEEVAAAVQESEAAPTMSWSEAMAETERVVKKRETRRSGPSKPMGRSLRKERNEPADPFKDMDLDEPWMAPGDLLDHPKLGRCRVMRVEGDSYAHIKLPRGRVRKLALEVLDVSFKGEEDGKNIFQARVRR